MSKVIWIIVVIESIGGSASWEVKCPPEQRMSIFYSEYWHFTLQHTHTHTCSSSRCFCFSSRSRRRWGVGGHRGPISINVTQI